MTRVRILSRAQRDLAEIEDWITLDNPARAASFVAELTAHFGRLAARP